MTWRGGLATNEAPFSLLEKRKGNPYNDVADEGRGIAIPRQERPVTRMRRGGGKA
ncbi:MAG: hypothetical protein LKK13_02760 [Bacilli bacterium]|nr:hypothetical protein [Bacilli bacterium]